MRRWVYCTFYNATITYYKNVGKTLNGIGRRSLALVTSKYNGESPFGFKYNIKNTLGRSHTIVKSLRVKHADGIL